ncbi:Alpha/Beta hydrolase protein, partial [Coemansia spiralis]
VDIDDTGNYIHTLAIRKKQQQQHNLVMTHGYFTGLGFFFRNYAELSRVDGWNIYSIDWLGMGRSARPTYKSGRARSEDARVANAEAFFVESLEEWRKRVGIERMTLCGHSFGGYLNAVYALKYPQHVEKLVLVSPIGIPEQPADFEEKLRQGHGPARNRHPPAAGAAAGDKTPEYEDASDASPAPDKPSRLRVAMFRGLLGLWERNYAPQDIVRAAGPFGRRLINMYVNRFSWLADEQRKGLGEYALQISTLPGSSEYALGDILRPGAFARRPLIDRLADIKMPTVFMYGENDWVDHTGGEQAIRRINGKVSTRLYRIAKAGHNLHLENSVDFNKALVKEM